MEYLGKMVSILHKRKQIKIYDSKRPHLPLSFLWSVVIYIHLCMNNTRNTKISVII